MHLGNARTALLAWLAARKMGGSVVLRVEDLDGPRVVPGAEQRLLDELRWLGLDWDEGPDRGGPCGPYRQSERAALYQRAVADLLAAGRAFLCACSRADVARAASAPHDNDPGQPEGLPYPGTCRGLEAGEAERRAASLGRRPVVRFRAGVERFAFVDLVHGPVDPTAADDFVLRRADGTAAYQLAVVVDDAAMRISDVVRGDDLLSSTPRQLALYAALALPAPRFGHVPLVLAPGGQRLAKRNRPASVAQLREAGLPPERIVGALAASAGLCPPDAVVRAADLLPGFDLAKIARQPAVMDLAISRRD
jgi:glutamyl-tRNA synthetase